MKSRCVELCRARPLLGTLVEIAVRSHQVERFREAIDRAFAEISKIQQRMSFHDPSSTLSQVNRQAFTRPVPVDRQTYAVLETAKELYQVSNGLFDPTIVPELERAGFLPALSIFASERKASFADVALLDGNRVRFRSPAIRIDLGGLAKGFAVDQAVSILCEAGVDSGLVNAGGDLRAFGAHSFAVEIRDGSDPGRMLPAFPARNVALATSAHYFADRIRRGASIGPFVHPFARQLQGNLRSVTVAAASAMVADGLTKVVMLDPASSVSILKRYNAAALAMNPTNALFCTSAWHELFQAAT
jgi:thiamine biosynthesis lipoprotein